MVAELEAEAAAALATKEAELAEAQRSLDSAVANRFAQLEKQLDAKVRGGFGGRTRDGGVVRASVTNDAVVGT